MPTLAIVCVVAYLLGGPILLWSIGYAHRRVFIDRKLNGKKKVDPRRLPEPVWPKWKERIRFAFKDGRPAFKGSGPKNSMVFLMLWLAGLALAVAAGFLHRLILLPISFLLFFVAMGFAISTAKAVLEARKKAVNTMYAISCLKGVTESGLENPNEVVHVLKWDNYVDPVEVRFDLSTKFSDSGEEGFMQHFNQYFGTELTWVPNFDEQTGATGWDYKNFVVTIHTVPPLPTRAPWHERYALDPGIAWSFFAMGLGVENGVEMPNPETGEIEHVLGFDVAGNEGKVGKEAGYKVSPKISTTPMAMVAGATGGGKAEDVDTMVMVVVPD